MPAELLRIADAVVAAINAAGLGLPAPAERLYLPQFELPEVQTLRVVVVPKEAESKSAARDRRSRTCRVDVGVLKKFQKGDAAELDPLVKLVDEIAALFDGKRLADAPEAICTAAKPEPVYSPEHMETLRQFTSVLALTFREVD
jgi:hypothetical protein